MAKVTRAMIYLEDALMAGIMISALWLFSLDFNSHFTLPKLAASGVVIGALSLPLMLRFYYGDINRLPVRIWMVVCLLLIWWLVGTSQSMHLQTALFGQPGRFNGLYTHIMLLCLFIWMACIPFDSQRSHRFIILFYLAMVPVCGFGLWQYFVDSGVFEIHKQAHRPISSIGNPVSLAATIAMAYPFVIQGMVVAHKGWWRAVLAVFLLALLLLLLLTTSRGGWLGAMAALVVLVYANRSLWTRFRFKTIGWYLLALVVLFGLALFVGDAGKIFERILNLQVLGTRMIYYAAALAVIKDHLLFGTGFESFRLIYPTYRSTDDSEGNALFDITPTMVHNDYLQMAVDNGLPAMLFFIVLVVVSLGLMIKAIKHRPESRNTLVPVVAAIAAYLAQSLTGWYEISTLVLFWLLLGFGVAVSVTGDSAGESNNIAIHRMLVMLALAAFVFLAYFCNLNLNTLALDNALRQTQIYQRAGQSQEVDRLAADIDGNSGGNFYYKDQLGLIYLNRLAKYRSISDYRKAHDYFARAVVDNPYNAYVSMHLVLVDTLAIRLKLIRQPSEVVKREVGRLAQKDPRNPSAYEALAKYYAAIGNRDEARRNLEKMEAVAGGKENLIKRAEALKKRAENKRR